MKFSLRNLALAAVATVACSVVAQDAVVPTVTQKWSHEKLTGPGKNDSRFGTGTNGKIYYNDKANAKVVAIDSLGQQTTFAAVESLGVGISSDDAGNLLVNTSFPNAASGTNFIIIAPDGTQTALTLTMPEGITAARVDQIGRIVGDMLSEEGAFFFLGENGATKVALIQVKNGAQVTDELSYYASEDLAAPSLNTSSVVNPTKSFEEMVDLGDDALNTFAARNRSTKSVYYFNEEGEFVTMPVTGVTAHTQEGFDVFTLGDVLYQVVPIQGSKGGNYTCAFAIADEQGNVIFTFDKPDASDANQNFGSICAHKVSDYKVEVYHYYTSGNGITASMFEVTLPEPTPTPTYPNLYLAGSFQNWEPENATELVAAEGTYTYHFESGAENGFKISTAKGNWEVFNAGALGAADDNTTKTLNAGDSIKLEAGKLGNLAAPAAGDWTITINGNTNMLYLTGDAAPTVTGPTVTQKWSHEKLTGPGKNDSRFGTGSNGKIYYNDKANAKVVAIDSLGQQTTFAAVESLGVGISSDDAGNLLVNTSFPNAASGTNFIIIAPDGTQTALTLTMPEGITAARVDQIGRIVGDMLSEEGAFFFLGENGATKVALIQVKNGAQVTDELSYYASEDLAAPSLNTSAIVNPTKSFEEMVDLGDDALNTFAARNRSTKSVYYFNEEGEFVTMPVTGVTAHTQEGFDVFTLGDVLYQVVPIQGSKGGNYTCAFAIADEQGNVIFTFDKPDASDANQNFGSICAHKVSDYKVEVYHYYTSGNGITASMFEVTLPEPTPTPTYPNLYLAGSFQDWDPENATELVAAEGTYTYHFESGAENGFKISTAKGNWEVFNAGALGAADDNTTKTLNAGDSIKLEAGKLGNLAAPAPGDWTITIDGNTNMLYLTGTADKVEVNNLYAAGDFQNWDPANAAEFVKGDDGLFTLDAENAEGNFKLSMNKGGWDDEGGFNAGLIGVTTDTKLVEGTPVTLVKGGNNNIIFPEKGNWTLTFDPEDLSLVVNATVAPDKPAEKSHFAYGLKAEKGENNTYTISFYATGAAPKAVLVLTEKESGAETEVELGSVEKGLNTFTYDAKALSEGKAHNFAIRLHNNKVETTVMTEPVNVGGGRAGLVVFTDPEYPEVFGKVAIGRTKAGGVDVYNPEGEKVVSAAHAGNTFFGGASANTSCPMDGKARKTEAVFAAWGDAAYGVTAVDIANIDAEPYSVFEGTKDSSGKITNGDVAVGSGTPCVAFQGKGDKTLMFTFDEDIFSNHLTVSHIGDNKTVGTALVDLGFGGKLANTNVAMWPTEKGLFLSQVRANGMDSGVYGLCYYDVEFEDITWNVSEMAQETDSVPFLPSTAAGVCVNPAGNLLAVATYTGIEVYQLSWNNDLPVLAKYKSITSSYASSRRTNIAFDVANNLHVVNQDYGYYIITMAEDEPTALTAAQKVESNEIQNASGVENIAVDEADADAVYYNLNGVRVEKANMAPGVYVKVAGKVATKVVVK